MGRYVDGHIATRSNPDVGNTLLTVGIVAGAGWLFIRWLGQQKMQLPGTEPGGIINPDTWSKPNPAIVPDSMYIDASGRWCWTEAQTGEVKCASQPGFNSWW